VGQRLVAEQIANRLKADFPDDESTRGARQLESPLVLPHEGMLPDALLSSHFILLPSRGLPGAKRPAPSSNRLFSGSRLSVGAIA
jgi:hypothetical protein